MTRYPVLVGRLLWWQRYGDTFGPLLVGACIAGERRWMAEAGRAAYRHQRAVRKASHDR